MKPTTIKIDEVEYVRKDSILATPEPKLTNQVIVRSKSAGVFFGELTKTILAEGRVEMKNVRRIWYWEGAASLSQLAVDGTSKPKSCKFPIAVPEITILEVLEIIPTTEKAAANIHSVPVWKQ